jgi:hypothetical protein
MDDSIESFAAALAQADNQSEQPATGSESVETQGADDEASTGDAQDVSQEAQSGEDGAAEGEQGEQSEESEQDSDAGANDPVHKWTTAAGEAFEVPESELRNGYLRTQDYTAKTQQHAEAVRQAQASIQFQQQALQALAPELGEIQSIQSQIAHYNGVDWAALEARDPQEAHRHQVRLLSLKQNLTDAQQRTAGKAGEMKRAQDAYLAHSIAAAEQHLATKLPGLSRDEIGQVFARMAKLGATQVELNHMRGMPWLVEAAVYANRWLDLQAKKPDVHNKVRKLPPPTTKPRAAVPSTKTDTALKAINSRSSFSRDEFARLLASTNRPG